jgi:predicted dehydrogenase
MRALAREAGVVNLVNYEFRYNPVRQRLRQLVQSGAIGVVEHVQWTAWNWVWRPAARRLYSWSFDADLGGGWVRVWGAHQIDYIRWAFGEIVEANSSLRITVPERPDATGKVHRCTGETGFTGTLRTETCASVTLESNATSPVERPSRVTVIGADGVLEMLSDNVHEIGGWLELHTEDDSTEVYRQDQEGDNHELEMVPWAVVVRDAVRSGVVGPDVPTFTDGAACAEVMDRLAAR